MTWTVLIHDDFNSEYELLSTAVQDELLAHLKLIEYFGPNLSRPHADTLKNSKFKNMKELRFSADDGVWRVAFAFDPLRKAIVLVAGDKSGMSSALFYKRLIKKADERFKAYLSELETER